MIKVEYIIYLLWLLTIVGCRKEAPFNVGDQVWTHNVGNSHPGDWWLISFDQSVLPGKKPTNSSRHWKMHNVKADITKQDTIWLYESCLSHLPE